MNTRDYINTLIVSGKLKLQEDENNLGVYLDKIYRHDIDITDILRVVSKYTSIEIRKTLNLVTIIFICKNTDDERKKTLDVFKDCLQESDKINYGINKFLDEMKDSIVAIGMRSDTKGMDNAIRKRWEKMKENNDN